jgi:hypothetical protein
MIEKHSLKAHPGYVWDEKERITIPKEKIPITINLCLMHKKKILNFLKFDIL